MHSFTSCPEWDFNHLEEAPILQLNTLALFALGKGIIGGIVSLLAMACTTVHYFVPQHIPPLQDVLTRDA